MGLLLQSIPYLGRKKIFKIFTPTHGLLSFFTQNSLFSPFSLIECVYHPSQKEIYTLQDITLVDPLLHLRESYPILSAAGLIAQDLLRTQLPQKQAPELFDLTLLYLKKLPLAPELILASFRLKLLLHEGLLSNDPDPSFTPSEWDQVQTLAFSRKLSEIQSVIAPPHSKIKQLCNQRFL